MTQAAPHFTSIIHHGGVTVLSPNNIKGMMGGSGLGLGGACDHIEAVGLSHSHIKEKPVPHLLSEMLGSITYLTALAASYLPIIELPEKNPDSTDYYYM